MNSLLVFMFTAVLFGGWIGWSFMWAQIQATVGVTYSCDALALGNTTTTCGSAGCDIETPFALHCEGSIDGGSPDFGIRFNQSGSYAGTALQARTYFNASVIRVQQTAAMLNFVIITENKATGPLIALLAGVLTACSVCLLCYLFDDSEKRKRRIIQESAQAPDEGKPEGHSAPQTA